MVETLAAARVEMLDPKEIKWPEGRITSEYDEEKAPALRQSMAERWANRTP